MTILPTDARNDDEEQARLELEQELENLSLLEDVVHWAAAAQPPRKIVDVVFQDEYSHDVVVDWRERFLVFDTDCLGGLHSVAIWSHQPTPDELLELRLQRGWQPTPTGTVDGPKILGHAACRVGK